MQEDKKVTVKKVYKDLKFSLKHFRPLYKEMKKDFEYAAGKQWDKDDVIKLESAGVKALTINKISSMIKLVSGIERQSRSDFVAFPEGSEDELLSNIVTRLLKNVVKQSKAERKTSAFFKEGVIAGVSYIEPYMDYNFDLINGEIKFRKLNASKCYPDPTSEEYDLSDSNFFIKITTDLTEDDLEVLFPNQKKKIDSIRVSKVNLDNIYNDDEMEFQDRDYPEGDNNKDDLEEVTYDLIEYYYKKAISVYYVVSATQGILGNFESEEEAKNFIAINNITDGSIVTKGDYEIRLKQVIGDTEFSDDRAWFYPRWKSFHFIPFIAEVINVEGLDLDLAIQGIVRRLRDLQDEYNKRRTQELRHLNSSQNSGNFIPKGALDARNKKILKEYGSSPGVTIEYDPEKAAGTNPQNWKITPTPLSQGHAQLAIENANDIKEISGVNPDLLANTDKDASGRAILLKQRQGLVMIQEALDNYQHSKELLGRFILTQLGEIYTVESAMRVLGEGFINDNFKKPVFGEDGNPQQDGSGQLQTETDYEEATVIINKVLGDTSLGKYDVSLGEGAFSETIKFANFVTLMELVEKGIPIPPEEIIRESLLSEAQKKKIVAAIESQRQAVQQGGIQ